MKPAFSNLEQLSQEEQTAVINAFKDLSNVQASGLRLAGQKFFTIQTTPDRSVYLKKQASCIESIFAMSDVLIR